jgi:hypothetical protein
MCAPFLSYFPYNPNLHMTPERAAGDATLFSLIDNSHSDFLRMLLGSAMGLCKTGSTLGPGGPISLFPENTVNLLFGDVFTSPTWPGVHSLGPDTSTRDANGTVSFCTASCHGQHTLQQIWSQVGSTIAKSKDSPLLSDRHRCATRAPSGERGGRASREQHIRDPWRQHHDFLAGSELYQHYDYLD